MVHNWYPTLTDNINPHGEQSATVHNWYSNNNPNPHGGQSATVHNWYPNDIPNPHGDQIATVQSGLLFSSSLNTVFSSIEETL